MIICIQWDDKDKAVHDLDIGGDMTRHPLIVSIDFGEIIINPNGTCYDDSEFCGTWSVVTDENMGH